MENAERLYSNRFKKEQVPARKKLWKILCRDFFQAYVKKTDTVLDLGAGSCEFINEIKCREKIAVDAGNHCAANAQPDVKVIQSKSIDLGVIPNESADVVFVSNFFEHLPDKKELLATLAEINRVLRPDGKLLILQPNIRLIQGAYWDFLDHHLPLTDRSMAEALDMAEFKIKEIRPRFLPYTTKGPLIHFLWLVPLYLKSPLCQWLWGKQSWFVAEKVNHHA